MPLSIQLLLRFSFHVNSNKNYIGKEYEEPLTCGKKNVQKTKKSY